MSTLTMISAVAGVLWIFFFFLAKPFRKQYFWMGFLATILVSSVLLLNQSWIAVAATNPYFGVWLADILVMVLFCASLSAIAYEWIFHIHWKREPHGKHHHVGLLALGPIVVFIGFLLLPTAAVHFIIIGLVIEVVTLLILRSDLMVDGLFSGLFFGTLLTVLFTSFFGNIPGTFFATWQLSGVTLGGLPVELILFFYFFGVLWGPWYEVVKDYHPKA